MGSRPESDRSSIPLDAALPYVRLIFRTCTHPYEPINMYWFSILLIAGWRAGKVLKSLERFGSNNGTRSKTELWLWKFFNAALRGQPTKWKINARNLPQFATPWRVTEPQSCRNVVYQIFIAFTYRISLANCSQTCKWQSNAGEDKGAPHFCSFASCSSELKYWP